MYCTIRIRWRIHSRRRDIALNWITFFIAIPSSYSISLPFLAGALFLFLSQYSSARRFIPIDAPLRFREIKRCSSVSSYQTFYLYFIKILQKKLLTVYIPFYSSHSQLVFVDDFETVIATTCYYSCLYLYISVFSFYPLLSFLLLRFIFLENVKNWKRRRAQPTFHCYWRVHDGRAACSI